MYKQYSYEGKQLMIKTIDNMVIEGIVLDDSNVDYMMIEPTNFESEPIKLMRKEIYLTYEKD